MTRVKFSRHDLIGLELEKGQFYKGTFFRNHSFHLRALDIYTIYTP
ncbi:hypothetical protein J2S17_003771 [Cytobacillus purgationiresistens]|uniref:Uncharacterized protein n=1 Tax=Cytobacillus purgationiresistens TaxID=863449 RepID=A0ABU0AKU0_9BACI|nr:hypothetical protein [Cytobacillus purgationiresistens]